MRRGLASSTFKAYHDEILQACFIIIVTLFTCRSGYTSGPPNTSSSPSALNIEQKPHTADVNINTIAQEDSPLCIERISIPEGLRTPADFRLLFQNALLSENFIAIQESLLSAAYEELKNMPASEEGDGNSPSGQKLMRLLDILARYQPHVHLNPDVYPPRLLKLFQHARSRVRMERLYVHTDPRLQGARVNGLPLNKEGLIVPRDIRLVIQYPSQSRPGYFLAPIVLQSHIIESVPPDVDHELIIDDAGCLHINIHDTSRRSSWEALGSSSAHAYLCSELRASELRYLNKESDSQYTFSCREDIVSQQKALWKRPLFWVIPAVLIGGGAYYLLRADDSNTFSPEPVFYGD